MRRELELIPPVRGGGCVLERAVNRIAVFSLSFTIECIITIREIYQNAHNRIVDDCVRLTDLFFMERAEGASINRVRWSSRPSRSLLAVRLKSKSIILIPRASIFVKPPISVDRDSTADFSKSSRDVRLIPVQRLTGLYSRHRQNKVASWIL